MEYRSHEIKAGIFIGVSIIIFLGFVFIISGLSSLENKEVYRTRFGFVGGIENGSLVRFSGMEVGRVVGIAIPDDGDTRVELKLEVREGTPIRENCRAYITSIGLMGAYYVEISAGSPEKTLLPAGSLIQSRDVSGFGQMSGPMTEATEQATELLENINTLLNDKNQKNIAALIEAMTNMAQDNRQNLSLMLENMVHISERLDKTLISINSVVVSNDSTIHQNMAALHALLLESKTAIGQLNSTLSGLDGMIVQNRQNYHNVMNHLQTISANMEQFSQGIKEQPWSLVRKNYPPERKLPE